METIHEKMFPFFRLISIKESQHLYATTKFDANSTINKIFMTASFLLVTPSLHIMQR
jgi:hypothetical protein